jgi:hypothetical protein
VAVVVEVLLEAKHLVVDLEEVAVAPEEEPLFVNLASRKPIEL